MINRLVIQTVSAHDWQAVFAEDGLPRQYPVAFWALVEDRHGDRSLTGILADERGFTDASEEPGFLGYLPPDQFADDVYGEAAKEYQKRILSNRKRDNRLPEQQAVSRHREVELTGGLR